MTQVYRVQVAIVGAGMGSIASDPTKLPKDGSAAMTGNLPFGGKRGVDAANAIDPQDLVPLGQLDGIIGSLTIDQIAPAFSIASIALNQSALVEVGTTLSSIVLSATYISGPPVSASVADSDGHTWATMTSPFASCAMTGTVQKTTHGATWTATLTATKIPTKTASVTVTWAARQYWGVGAAGLTAAQIQALGNSSLSAGKIASFTVSPSNQKVYFLWPQALGSIAFWTSGNLLGINAPQSGTITENGQSVPVYWVETTYLQNLSGMLISLV